MKEKKDINIIENETVDNLGIVDDSNEKNADIVLAKRKKPRFKIKLRDLVILIAFIAIASVSIINIKNIMKDNEQKGLDIFDIAGNEEQNVNNGTNENSVADSQNNNKDDKIYVKANSIGVIDIPSVGVRGQIAEGTDEQTLKNFVGKFEGSVGPGEKGNFSLAAHNNVYTEIFRNLHKVNTNDEIRIITKNKEYIYKVMSKEIVDPSKIEVLNNTDKTEITLVTCTDMAKSRVIVKGRYISQKDIK